MGDSKHKLAIVGFGGMGNWHRNLLEVSDEITCKGVYDIDPKRMDYASSLGLIAYDSLEALLSDEEIDIVLVATPNDSHRDLSIRCMRAGKAVVCEKPVTMNSGELQDIYDVAHETGMFFTVHQNRRWDEDYKIARHIFEEKLLGPVFTIESRVHGSRGIPGDWRGRKEQGGGMVLDWGVHILDQILQFVPGKVKSVYATLNHVTNYEVDDGFRIILNFDSGVNVLTEVGTSNFASLPRWYILGENGTAVIDDFSCSGKIVSVHDWDVNDAIPVKTAAGLTKTMAPRIEEAIIETPLPRIESDIRDFYKNVVGVLEGRETSLIKDEEVMRCMKLMEAAFESARTGQVLAFE